MFKVNPVTKKLDIASLKTTNDKGWFATGVALNAAYPVGQAGWYAEVVATGTIWYRDVGTLTWIDSLLLPPVQSVTGANVDNTDPANPVIDNIVVDGLTITGTGVTGDPLIATATSETYKVSVDGADTVGDYLDPKINIHSTDGSITVTKTITAPGGNEILDFNIVTNDVELYVESVTGNIVDNSDPFNPIVDQVQADWNQSNSGEVDYIKNKPTITSGTVESVTGLNTDNTDPANPIVKISVDGVSITGAGTPISPLIAHMDTPSLNNTEIAYGNPGNLMTSSPNFTYDAVSESMTIGDVTLDTSLPTIGRNYQFPDNDGVIALVSDIPTVYVVGITDDGNGQVSINNTDPANPIVEFTGVVSDGITITGTGLAGNPLMASPVGVGRVLRVDKYRTDTYTPTGSEVAPYLTIMDAVNQIIAVAVPGQDWTIKIMSGQYVENVILENANLNMIALDGVGVVGIAPASGNAIQCASNNGNLTKFRMRNIEMTRPFYVVGPDGGTTFSDVWLVNCVFTGAATLTANCIKNLSLSGGYIETAVSLTNVEWFYSDSKQMQGTFNMTCDSTLIKPSGFTGGTSMINGVYGTGAVTLTKGGTATGVVCMIGSRMNSSSGTITIPAGRTVQQYGSHLRGNVINNGTLQLRTGFVEGTLTNNATLTLNQKCKQIQYDPITSGLTATDVQAAIDELALEKLDTVAVDGITITGDGTVGNPLVATAVTEDWMVAVSAVDTTPGYLSDKLISGANISLTASGAGNETYTCALDLPMDSQTMWYDNSGTITKTWDSLSSIGMNYDGSGLGFNDGGTNQMGFSPFGITGSNGFTSINLDQGTLNFIRGINDAMSYGYNSIVNAISPGNQQTITFETPTAVRALVVPNKSGTFALTSDILPMNVAHYVCTAPCIDTYQDFDIETGTLVGSGTDTGTSTPSGDALALALWTTTSGKFDDNEFVILRNGIEQFKSMDVTYVSAGLIRLNFPVQLNDIICIKARF